MSDTTESLRAELNDMARICDLELRDDDAKLMRKAATALARLEAAERVATAAKVVIRMHDVGYDSRPEWIQTLADTLAALALKETPHE